ncbi:MAG: PAS domain S-box protein [Desulfobacteraceae bacterium]|nr:PAS domain S-box protein [Desulfobacteraceae bacterium]
MNEKIYDELDWRIRVFESLSFPTLILTPGKVILTANRVFLEKQHMVLDSIVGKTCSEVFYGSNGCRHRACPFIKVLENKKGESVLRRRPTRTGKVFWEERLFSPILDDNGDVIYVMESVRDVTRMKTLEIALKETEAFLEKIILNSPVAIVAADHYDNILLMNPAAESLFGYKNSEAARTLTMEQLYEPGVARRIMRQLRHDDGDGVGKLHGMHASIVNSWGETIPAEINASIIYEDDEEIAKVCLYTDLSDKIRIEKKLEEARVQLAQSEKMASIGQLAAGVAHEINNPLTSILFYSSLKIENLPLDDPEREELLAVVEDVNRCKGIVKSLLEYSRRSVPAKELIDVNTIIERSLTLIRDPKMFGKIKILRDFSDELLMIEVDKNQISQVLINLVINAIAAMDGDGQLTLCTRPDKQRNKVCLEVSDTGCGIRKEDLTKIFDPFFTTKELGKGTGLGLSTAYGLVKENNGNISVKHTGAGGTTFLLEFPTNLPISDAKDD